MAAVSSEVFLEHFEDVSIDTLRNVFVDDGSFNSIPIKLARWVWVFGAVIANNLEGEGYKVWVIHNEEEMTITYRFLDTKSRLHTWKRTQKEGDPSTALWEKFLPGNSQIAIKTGKTVYEVI
uniref:Uncharacterized protein n=1 Tax=Rhizobium phage LG08 TaxID=3129229 RepID=A0AAU8HYI0_9CAUD